jgi:hypothetical protein
MISERELLDQREKEEFTRIRGHEPSVERAFREYRDNVWNSVDSMLSKAEPFVSSGVGCTGLALGYVQSGKTTSIVGLLAAACDAGYRLIIGLIAVNDNLLDQNAKRILGKLGIVEDGRRVWYTSVQGSQPAEDDEVLKNIEQRGRTVLILVLKNKPQIEKISNLLDKLDSTKHKVLVVDDEADQVSLNTKIKSGSQSPTYESIINLRKKLHGHLYIQYTATPYANLLLTPDDTLAPDFVEILTPGRGYTGGRSFFVDQGDTTFRSIGNETLREAPSRVPLNLERALANYLVGSTLMFCNEGDEQTRQTSMLINVHQENLVQEGYKSLIEKHISAWTVHIEQVTQISDLPELFQTQYADLIETGVDEPIEYLFIRQLKHLLTEVNVWLINQSMRGRIRWGDYKLHILIGANKLDRGFTVEGLTVTYMSRKESDQIDTMQQRSRAYGYRPFLKYCRIFTNNATRKILKDTVHTEEDLREQLYQWMQSGRDFKEWANQIGLIISKNAKPTRGSVVKELLIRNLGSWFFLLKSNTDDDTLDYNYNLLKQIGLIDAEQQKFGSQAHRHVVLEPHQAVELLAKWRVDLAPKWNEEAPLIRRTLLSPEPTKDIERLDLPKKRKIQMLLIAESGAGKQRTRSEWSPTTGLDPSDLFQNRNAEYPGDRNLFDESDGLIQVHQISISKAVPNAPSRPLYFLAIRLGKEWKSARRGGH